MAKDPAFLFYYQDFLVGSDHMTLEQVGGYIKCLCHQANRYTIRESHMASLVGSQENYVIVREKFIKDENGELFNERLRKEMEKRRIWTKSRLDNLHKASHVGSHMASHMENENEIVIKDKKQTKIIIPTLEEVKEYFKEKGTNIDPETFWNWYESRGWNGIKKWKSCLVTWEKRQPKEKMGEHKINNDRDIWEKKANKNCSNCRGSGSVYAPGTGKYARCGCSK